MAHRRNQMFFNGKRVKKILSYPKLKYYLAIKISEVLIHATTATNLQEIILNEIKPKITIYFHY